MLINFLAVGINSSLALNLALILFFIFLKGKKLFIWIGIPFLYGLVAWLKPVIFSSIYFSWFFNPHIGYIDDVNQVFVS